MTIDPVDLEQFVDRALADLPQPRAPRTLLPRVMSAVEQAARRPWYARAWFTWPRAWQAAFAAALLVSVVGGSMLVPTTSHLVTEVWNFRIALSTGIDVPYWVISTWGATRVLWRVIVEPVLPYVVVFTLSMSAACVAVGTALDRVALGGASES